MINVNRKRERLIGPKNKKHLPRTTSVSQLNMNDYLLVRFFLMIFFQNKTHKMKMYILVKREVPDKFVPVICAHASLACYKKFETDEDMQIWINSIFRKVVCAVSDKEFERAKVIAKSIIMTESALENNEVAIAFCPREEYPKQFRFFKMWSPSS